MSPGAGTCHQANRRHQLYPPKSQATKGAATDMLEKKSRALQCTNDTVLLSDPPTCKNPLPPKKSQYLSKTACDSQRSKPGAVLGMCSARACRRISQGTQHEQQLLGAHLYHHCHYLPKQQHKLSGIQLTIVRNKQQ